MNSGSDFVASGGWIKREYRTQPFTLLLGSVAFIAVVVTGVLMIAVVALWRLDGVIPFGALRWTLGGIPVTALLIAFTTFVAKREPERTILRYSVSNPEHDLRKLY